MRTVIFDLDGTITDPAEGITQSFNHALVELGHAAHPAADLLKYIGPHLNITFAELLGTSDEATLARAIELYRERYIPIGYRENRLYDGMQDVLSQLKSAGDTLCIATSKREDIAVSVLDFLGIAPLFSQVHGCDLHRTKDDLLRDILADDDLAESPKVMIGDRDVDFEAAAAVGIPSIGVRWGYGSDEELQMATALAEHPDDLPRMVEWSVRGRDAR
jgi:phosphoglycolate phosphatase